MLFFGWPEQWIKILGKRIARIHIKEYSRKIADTQGKSAGFEVKLLEGDVNWPAVMKALDELRTKTPARIVEERYKRLRKIGVFEETAPANKGVG